MTNLSQAADVTNISHNAPNTATMLNTSNSDTELQTETNLIFSRCGGRQNFNYGSTQPSSESAECMT